MSSLITLIACLFIACSAPQLSTPGARRVEAPGFLGLPGFSFLIHEDGSVEFPAWVERAGNRTVEIGDATVESIAKRSFTNFLRHYHEKDDLRTMISFRSASMTDGEWVRYEFLFQRPNRFAFVPEPGLRSPAIVSDGERMLTYMAVPGAPSYSFSDAPEWFEEASETIQARMTPSMGTELIVLTPLLSRQTTAESYLSYLASARHDYVWLDGSLVRRLQFIWPDAGGAMELWIDGKRNWLKRIYIGADQTGALDPDAESPRPLPAPNSRLAEFKFAEWSDDPLSDADFQFDLPSNAIEKDIFEQALVKAQKHPTLGKPAPAFTLLQIDGEDVSLESLLEKHDVLVLDFWATWCVPCLMSLPKVAETAAKYAAEGVGFCAVNYRDDEAKIRKLVEQRKFDFPVLMDREGKVGQAFGVSALPHTIVIDRNGTVRHVHIGAIPNLKEQLETELAQLCAEDEQQPKALTPPDQEERNADERE